MLYYALTEHGITAFIVSDESQDVPLSVRCKRENEIFRDQKARGNRTIFISIHADAFEREDAEGSTVFYHPKSKAGKRLAEIFYRNMTGNLIRARKPKAANYKVLRSTLSPAILIENGFMTNDRDLALLTNDRYRVDIVNSLTKAIQEEIKLHNAENKRNTTD